MEQEPEPWQSGAGGPAVVVDGPAGPVELWVRGDQRYRVITPTGEREVEGFRGRAKWRARWPAR